MQERNGGCKIIQQEMPGSGHFSTEYNIFRCCTVLRQAKAFPCKRGILSNTYSGCLVYILQLQRIQMMFSASNPNLVVWHTYVTTYCEPVSRCGISSETQDVGMTVAALRRPPRRLHCSRSSYVVYTSSSDCGDNKSSASTKNPFYFTWHE